MCCLSQFGGTFQVKVLCKVNHSDLRQLLLVSKPVSEATVVAKELHFAFATPSKASADAEEEDDGPGAPKQHRVARSRCRGMNLASVAVNLSESFSSLMSEV
uniref:Uncharacterized protein n=1 Tax=Aegilops tauschii subsp. strangulata TaxID=200361 RepID=A0A453BAS6_AEGTS